MFEELLNYGVHLELVLKHLDNFYRIVNEQSFTDINGNVTTTYTFCDGKSATMLLHSDPLTDTEFSVLDEKGVIENKVFINPVYFIDRKIADIENQIVDFIVPESQNAFTNLESFDATKILVNDLHQQRHEFLYYKSFLLQAKAEKFNKLVTEDLMIISESALNDFWLTPEEDEAWKDLLDI